jgi:hypothetical protein
LGFSGSTRRPRARDALGDDPLEVLRGDRIEQRLAVRLDVLD